METKVWNVCFRKKVKTLIHNNFQETILTLKKYENKAWKVCFRKKSQTFDSKQFQGNKISISNLEKVRK